MANVVTNPTADQTIQSFNLLPASGNATQSLGKSGAPWNATLGIQNKAVVWADQFPGADAGVQINNAIAALPTITVSGTAYPAGVVMLHGFASTQPVWSTPVAITSPFVSLIGPGKGALQFQVNNSSGTVSAPVEILSLRPGNVGAAVNIFDGPTISGFSMVNGQQDYLIAMSIGDALPFYLKDVLLFGFAGKASHGLWLNNINFYSEHYSIEDCIFSYCTYCLRFSNWNGNFSSATFPAVSPSTSGFASFGYGNFRNVMLQVSTGNAGNTPYGMYVDGNGGTNTAPIYHCHMDMFFEEVNANSSPLPNYVYLENHAIVEDNHYVWRIKRSSP